MSRDDATPLSLTKQFDLPARTPAAMTSGTPAHSEPTPSGVALAIHPGQVLADRYEVRATSAPAAWARSSSPSTVSARKRSPSSSSSRSSWLIPRPSNGS